MLLATSLKHFLQGDYELVAAIPHPAERWGALSASTYTLIEQLGIRTVPVANRIDENYPIGNKVACLNVETPAEQVIFLDSDLLCLQPFNPHSEFSAPFNAKPADLSTFTRELSQWQSVYQLFDLPLPSERMTATTSGELMLPYFNAGVIAVQNGLHFGTIWEECCQRIDQESTITRKRPWLDQIALPVTLARLNLSYRCLDERFNYPAHLKPLATQLPFLCHYHWASVIRREPMLNKLVAHLATLYPLLTSLLSTLPEWAQVLKPYILHHLPRRFLARPVVKSTSATQPRRFQHQQPTALITGIPRSGTSYLCRLLHTLQNCVVINEPTQIFAPLAQDKVPYQVAIFHQELRRTILDGHPVENKLHNGEVIEDTAIMDTRVPYSPQVSRPDFLLCTKNTLAYMARITQLRYVLPQTPIVACIRHPLDTIASWKTTFPHLRHATVTEFPVGHVNDPFLAGWQRQCLTEIALTQDEAIKRALLWRYLAECVLYAAQQLVIVRYEDLVQQPLATLKTILQQVPLLPPLYLPKPIVASRIRHKREALDAADIRAVENICKESAVALGFKV